MKAIDLLKQTADARLTFETPSLAFLGLDVKNDKLFIKKSDDF